VSAVQGMQARLKTTVIVTNKINILALADRVLILDGGTVQAFGPRDAILSRLMGPKVVTAGTPEATPAETRQVGA
jgi:ATP-binding cassette subfamily C protein